MKPSHILLVSLSMLLLLEDARAIYCYQCTSATPGCGQEFNWRGIGYWGTPCPEDEDICVKLIERKGANEMVTRECFSSLRAIRPDIPADQYEGCRPAVKDELLAHYVNNSIKEYDIRRDHYDSTTYCFCFLDHRCNGASSASVSLLLFAATAGLLFVGAQRLM